MFILFFILRPTEALEASRDGLMLWAVQILPALLPYTLLSGLILSSGIFAGKRKSSEIFIILCGFLFGFPMGSRLSADFCEKGLISQKRAQLLCAFTNNMSPVFVSTFVLESQLGCPQLRLQTFAILYGVPLVWGLFHLWRLHRSYPYTIKRQGLWARKKPAKSFDLNMQIIDAGILRSFETMIRLCGYIVIFSIMARMLLWISLPGAWTHPLLTGVLECTNGIAALAKASLPRREKYLAALVILSLGGVSGMAQTGSMIKECGLSLAVYIKHRLIITGLVLLAAMLILPEAL